MSHAESHKHEDNELLEDWTFVDHSEYTHFDEEEQNDEDSIEGAVAPPEEEEEEEEEVVTEEEEEVVQKAEGQKVEEIEDDEESLKKKVRKRKGEKSEEKGDKETDTAEDVPQTESDHGSSLHENMNKRLNGIVVAILVVISLLGLGHFIGWTSRSLWEQSLNAAQVRRSGELQDNPTSCVASSPPTDRPSPAVQHDSAFDDLKFDSLPFKDNLILPTPYKHDPIFLSAGSLIETFVEPLEDTGVILDASPFIEQHYETLTYAGMNSAEDSDKRENFIDVHPFKSNVIVDYLKTAKENTNPFPNRNVQDDESKLDEPQVVAEKLEDFHSSIYNSKILKNNLKSLAVENDFGLESYLEDTLTLDKFTSENILFSPKLKLNSKTREVIADNINFPFSNKFPISSDSVEELDEDASNFKYELIMDDVITSNSPESKMKNEAVDQSHIDIIKYLDEMYEITEIDDQVIGPNKRGRNFYNEKFDMTDDVHIVMEKMLDEKFNEIPDINAQVFTPNERSSNFKNEKYKPIEEESQNIYDFLKACINICKGQLEKFYSEIINKRKNNRMSQKIFEAFANFLNNYSKHKKDNEEKKRLIRLFSAFENKYLKDEMTVFQDDIEILNNERSIENDMLSEESSKDCQNSFYDNDKQEKLGFIENFLRKICDITSVQTEYFVQSRLFKLCHFLENVLEGNHFDFNDYKTHLQILEKLKIENEELQERILDLQAENIEPIKIKGREGKEGRSLREKINHLIGENEDMRLALSRHQFSALPDGDKNEFNKASQENHHLRKTVQQLIHLVPDFNKLEDSFESLTTEHTDLLKTVGKIRHEQTIPKELTPMVKQLEEMRSVVAAEIKKKNPPSTIANARSYIAYMSQVLSAFTFLHDLEEKSAADKIDIAKDIFSYWMPKGVNVPPKMQDEVVKARSQFTAVKSSLRKKWKQLKELTKPETIISVGQSTVAKMNRVIVNVVTKLKEIGQSTIMSTNKQFEQSVLALSSGLSKLNRQFDETWKSLEIRISMGERDDEDSDSGYDDNGEQNNDDDNEDDDDEEEGDDENENEKEASEKEIQRKESIIDINEKIAKDKNEGPHSQADTKSKAKAQTDESHKSPLESEEIKVEIQKQIKNKEFEKISGIVEKKRESQKEKKITPNIKKERSDRSQNLKQSVVEEKVVVHHRKDRNVEEEDEPRDHKKESKISLKDKIKEKKQEQKLMKEDSRYFKGQYNKFDKVRDATDKEVPDFTRKYYRQNDFDDDDDDDDDDHQVSKKSSGLKRHWEKPQKKSFFREQSGPKKQFIRRRGKDCYWDKNRDKTNHVTRWEQIGEGEWESDKIIKKQFKNGDEAQRKQILNKKKRKENKHEREKVKSEKSDKRKKQGQYPQFKEDKANHLTRWEQIGEGELESNKKIIKKFKNGYEAQSKQIMNKKKRKENKHEREKLKSEKSSSDKRKKQFKEDKVNKRYYETEKENVIQIGKTNKIRQKNSYSRDEKNSNFRNKDIRNTKNKDKKIRIEDYKDKKNYKFKSKEFATRR